ncbi:MAG: DUF5011 domain-containing protein [Bacteroidota bacterium]
MKRKLFFPALIILALMIVVASCKKEDDDTTAPVITLNGSNPVSIALNSTYSDAGATALDDVDGDISASITVSGTVNTTQKGTYTKTYSVSDAAGNTATATRTVYVGVFDGGYSVVDVVTGKNAGTKNYSVTVAAFSSVNNKFLIYNFGGFGSSVYIEITLSGSTLNIASQSPLMMSDPGTITGSGSTNTTDFTSINYTCIYTSSGSDVGSATYTKL